MTTIIDLLIPIVALLALSFAVSILRKGGFSMNIFMASFAIGLCILIWIPLVPSYMIIMTVLIMVGMLFSDNVGEINE